MSTVTNRQHLERLVPQNEARKWPRPECRRLIIVFTPRSGSSWFTDLLCSTRVLGTADELFNQDTNHDVVRRTGARTEEDYCNAIETLTKSANNFFSMEVIWGHIQLCEFDFLEYYRGSYFVYLRRKDILAQAISLLVATETGVFHNPSGRVQEQPRLAEQLVSSEMAFRGIRRWWAHLLNYECLTDIQFARRSIRPLRIYYEDLLEDAEAVVARVRDYCEVDPKLGGPPKSSYAPVRSQLNDELARLFRAEETEFIEAMDALRPPLL